MLQQLTAQLAFDGLKDTIQNLVATGCLGMLIHAGAFIGHRIRTMENYAISHLATSFIHPTITQYTLTQESNTYVPTNFNPMATECLVLLIHAGALMGH